MSGTHHDLWRQCATMASAKGNSLPEYQRDVEIRSAVIGAGLSEAEYERALAGVIGVDSIDDLSARPASAEFVSQVPIAFARRHRVLGLASDGQEMLVAVAAIGELQHVQVISKLMGRSVIPVFAEANQILTAINMAYQQRGGQTQAMLEKLDRQTVLDALAQIPAGRGRFFFARF